MNLVLPLLLAAVVSAAPAADPARDVHSFAQPALVSVEHAHVDLTVDFDGKTLTGTTTLKLKRKAPEAPLVLDTRDLDVTKAETSTDGKTFVPAKFSLGQADAVLGAPLTVLLPKDAEYVRVAHASRPNATALQWLTPEQTAGKKFPFLFTQSQAIHARSWLPLQDSPAVRITYSAKIRAPWPLGAIMSAEGNKGKDVARPQGSDKLEPGKWREFEFKMDKPIPSYLLALAVGDLGFSELGPRTGVYAEPATLEKAAKELNDVEGMLAAVEKLYGPYRWGRYDVLVLPPSFAYGGMENPLLTFASPTIIAGDKSLVAVLAHELAHSWSGNLVTNATWRDFWLNEGFTTYVEGRMIEAVYGKRRAAMEDVLGRQKLEEELKELPEGDRVLHIDMNGRDPDDGVTGVPYEKGALFLRHLETAFGRERFDKFVRGYFDANAFHSITTGDFRSYLEKNLLATDEKAAAQVPVEEWITKPGLPANAPKASAEEFAEIDELVKSWLAGKTSDAALAKQSAGWGYLEKHQLLRSLPQELASDKMARLDKLFGFTTNGNAELACEWLQLAVRSKYAPANARLEEFLTSVGRGKFVKPLYKALAKTPEGRDRAKAIFAKARPMYQVPVVSAVEKILAAKG